MAARADQVTDEQMSIYDAAMRYAQEGVPLVVIAGKEYGTGSSRDWAAKGTKLLGVRAVVAESFERIHRSNLIGMGVLPLQFPEGESAKSLGIDAHEQFSVSGFRRAAERGRATEDLQGARRRCRVRGHGAYRHPQGGRLLPPRRDPAVRAARSARSVSSAGGTSSGRAVGGDGSAGGFTQTLRDLLAARGPSGYETAPAAVWSAAAEGFGAAVQTDVVGTPSARVPARGEGHARTEQRGMVRRGDWS